MENMGVFIGYTIGVMIGFLIGQNKHFKNKKRGE